jgi:type IV pilus assembly protein PilQ
VKQHPISRIAAVAAALAVGLAAAGSALGQASDDAAGKRAGAPAIDTGNVNTVSTSSYFGNPTGPKYDIVFKQASLREVLQFLAYIADLNVILPQDLDGIVDVNFRGVRVEDALNAIIRSNALEYAIEGNVVRIGKSEQFKEFGEDLKSETFRLRYAPAKDTATKVQTLISQRGSVIADERTNSIIVREVPGNLEKVRRFVGDIDIKDAQVLIESKILEATRRFTQALGIQWGVTHGADGSTLRVAGVQAVGQADSGRNLNVNLGPQNMAPTSGLLIGSLINGTNLDVQLLAAEARGDIYVISDPSIVTSNGKSANIRSGATLLLQNTSDNVTIGTGTSTTGTGSSITERKTGVELTVTPQITIHDYVKMEIEASTSTPDFTNQVQGIPTILDNVAKTTVLVKDGETTVIGGLSRLSDQLRKGRVPYLSRIPLVGNLFKSKERDAQNSELMVFIKPSIIRVEGTEPAQMRVREVEERREAMLLKPILDPQQVNADRAKKGTPPGTNRGRGNKYLR